MIISIARKEFTEIVRDGRFKWNAAIMVLLLLTAMLAGYQKYTTAVRIQQAAQAVIDRTGASGPGDKGKVMGPLMADLRGQADGRLVNEVVGELLGG